MARLRIRIELSRGGVGVPLHKLASVVEESQRFFHMLAEDVHIDQKKGEWLGFDFDNESLNFTAEFVGPVTTEQVSAFYAAFDGTTQLRRATIAQFARITDAIGEEELIGFGLYQADPAEPSEWRCLSRRDALRITEEIQVLLGAAGEGDQESRLPAVSDSAIGTRLFGDRRLREVETNFSERLTRIERKVEQHSTQIHDMRSQSAAAEESFRNLLGAVETFCDQATQQIERVSPAALPAARRRDRRWTIAAVSMLGAAVLILAGFRIWPAHAAPPTSAPPVSSAPPPVAPAQSAPTQSAPAQLAPAQAPSVKPASVQQAVVPPLQPTGMRVELDATEPSWVSVASTDGTKLMSRLVEPGSPHTLDLDHPARLRTGNAGGLNVRFNGKSLGALGTHGQIREIEFKNGVAKILPSEERAAKIEPK